MQFCSDEIFKCEKSTCLPDPQGLSVKHAVPSTSIEMWKSQAQGIIAFMQVPILQATLNACAKSGLAMRNQAATPQQQAKAGKYAAENRMINAS